MRCILLCVHVRQIASVVRTSGMVERVMGSAELTENPPETVDYGWPHFDNVGYDEMEFADDDEMSANEDDGM